MSNWSWAQELHGGILEDLLPHPLTVARALADQEFQLVHKYVFTSGRLPFHLHDEMRLLLTGDGGLTVHLTVSLSAHPADFIMTITGTRSTLRIDLRNKLSLLSRDHAGLNVFARGVRVSGAALHVLAQTTRNAIGAAFGAPRPGDPVISSARIAKRLNNELKFRRRSPKPSMWCE